MCLRQQGNHARRYVDGDGGEAVAERWLGFLGSSIWFSSTSSNESCLRQLVQSNKQSLQDASAASRKSSHRSSRLSFGETSKQRASCRTYTVTLAAWVCCHGDGRYEAGLEVVGRRLMENYCWWLLCVDDQWVFRGERMWACQHQPEEVGWTSTLKHQQCSLRGKSLRKHAGGRSKGFHMYMAAQI